MTEVNPYEQAYQRERAARLKAEELLEDKARELYQQNCRLEESYEKLKQHQAHILTQDKMATLGTLSAGVAHELNNPLAFVKSNFESLQKYHQAYAAIFALLKQIRPQLNADLVAKIDKEIARSDLEFIEEDMPELMADTSDGLSRVKDIVQNLRNFSHSDTSEKAQADLLEGLHSTIKLLKNELKNSLSVQLQLQPIDKIECNANELNQVFLNLILNAKHATELSASPTLVISSMQDEEFIYISLRDNGCGIKEDVLKEIFVPFFTTKPAGKGTGMGLAISYNIIQKYNGELQVKSTVGEGTEFTIKLPKTSCI